MTRDEAIKKIKTWDFLDNDEKEVIETLIPELAESKDERIRKALVRFHKSTIDIDGIKGEEILAWLEKQGQKKPQGKTALEAIHEEKVDNANKVEPKFHEGDYIKHNKANIICKVISVNSGSYYVENIETGNRIELFSAEQNFHLWTIEDAKDGDVLAYVTDEEDLWIMIYWSLYEPYEGHVHYHALLVNDNFSDKGTCCICIDNLKPATKEQRDFLFKRMREAGYEWDVEKKEVKKIEWNNIVRDSIFDEDIDIPFGAIDSELYYQEINIPEGFQATIEGRKIILKKEE